MRHSSASEKLLIDEINRAAKNLQIVGRGVSIGEFIKLIRIQLGMSQAALANYANVPQSTVSRIEKGKRDPSITTLKKILKALSCDLLIVPLLQESIETIRRKQARKKALKRISYLKGTMNLEKQLPDDKFIEELLRQEEELLLQGPNSKLWEE